MLCIYVKKNIRLILFLVYQQLFDCSADNVLIHKNNLH